MKDSNQYDAIVIGSGIGGLTAAALLAKIKSQKVLLLERHWVLGGQTHEFTRKQYSWDVGLHYVGDMDRRDLPRQVFDFVSDGNLKWNKMPEDFERFVYPGTSFAVPSQENLFRSRLKQLFPEEADGIDRYFSDIRKTVNWSGRHFALGLVPDWLRPLFRLVERPRRSLALSLTREILERHFQDEKIRSLIVSQWGDYGLPPNSSAFVIHALIASHYLKGGYYPVGGASQIARTIIPVIEAAGGHCIANCEVKEILLKNQTAIGIKAIQGKSKRQKELQFYSPRIISNAGALVTFRDLLRGTDCSEYTDRLDQLSLQGFSAVTLYLGLKKSPEGLGFQGENHWIYRQYDHDSADLWSTKLAQGKCQMAYLSFPSLKDPQADQHKAEVISLADYRTFATWSDKPWKKRGEDYEALKTKIANGMLDLVEHHYPGFRENIDYWELSTPLSMEHFTNRNLGLMYGIPATPGRFQLDWLIPRTPIKNLFLSGSDVCSPGIVGAMMGGLFAASAILGSLGIFKIMYQIKKAAKTVPD